MEAKYTSSPPPPPPKVPFAVRYKFLWPVFLTVNLGVAAYIFTGTKKKDTDVNEKVPAAVIVSSSPVSTTIVPTEPVPSLPVVQPMKPLEPIPETSQRELFKWILKEKRKASPKDAKEKKQIDEEKAVLKHFIRAKSIPGI